jgi:hypothetical protein
MYKRHRRFFQTTIFSVIHVLLRQLIPKIKHCDVATLSSLKCEYEKMSYSQVGTTTPSKCTCTRRCEHATSGAPGDTFRHAFFHTFFKKFFFNLRNWKLFLNYGKKSLSEKFFSQLIAEPVNLMKYGKVRMNSIISVLAVAAHGAGYPCSWIHQHRLSEQGWILLQVIAEQGWILLQVIAE